MKKLILITLFLTQAFSLSATAQSKDFAKHYDCSLKGTNQFGDIETVTGKLYLNDSYPYGGFISLSIGDYGNKLHQAKVSIEYDKGGYGQIIKLIKLQLNGEFKIFYVSEKHLEIYYNKFDKVPDYATLSCAYISE